VSDVSADVSGEDALALKLPPGLAGEADLAAVEQVNVVRHGKAVSRLLDEKQAGSLGTEQAEEVDLVDHFGISDTSSPRQTSAVLEPFVAGFEKLSHDWSASLTNRWTTKPLSDIRHVCDDGHFGSVCSRIRSAPPRNSR
jgi:hypothetical protein